MNETEQRRRIQYRFDRIAFVSSNETRPCDVSGCVRRRAGLGKLCAKHHQIRTWRGHALGREVKRSETAPYEQMFRDFKKQFPAHPAVAAAERWLDDLLREPRKYLRQQVAIDRLEGAQMRGATGVELLEILAGAFLLAHFQPVQLPDDERLTYLLARRTISSWRRGRKGTMGPRDNAERQPPLRRPTTTLRAIGNVLRAHIGVLFVRVAERMDRDASALQALRTELFTPFTTPAEIAAQQTFQPHEDS